MRWPDWPVIGYPLLVVHPSISIVKLTVIGYHCNHLDRQLNYQASALWPISVTIMYMYVYEGYLQTIVGKEESLKQAHE